MGNILQIEDKRSREKAKGAIYSSFVFSILKILRPGKKGKLWRRLNPIFLSPLLIFLTHVKLHDSSKARTNENPSSQSLSYVINIRIDTIIFQKNRIIFFKIIVQKKITIRISKQDDLSKRKTLRVKVVPFLSARRNGRGKEGRRGAGFHSSLPPPWRRGNAIFSSFHVPLPRARSLLAPLRGTL